MKQPIHVTPVPNEDPDLDRFVAALAAVVLARLDEEDERSTPEREGDDA